MTRIQRSSTAEWLRAATAVLLAAVWLAMLELGRGPLDRAIYEALYAGGHPILIVVARTFTLFGEPTVLVVAGLVWAWWLWKHSRGRLALALLFVTLLGRGLSEIQKYSIARARPALEPHLVVVQTWSFPSGHAASSMIFYTTMALALTVSSRWYRLTVGCAILLSLLIGTSRVMLGVHWPSDVVGGWSFGALWVLLTLPFAERLFRADSPMPSKAAIVSRSRGEGT